MADKQQTDAATAPHDATESIAQALSEALKHPTYACGGTVKAVDEIDPNPAITIRWDCADSNERLTLPCNNSGAAKSPLEKLLNATTPAGFGFQGKDVIDELYRKASKLDASTFSTDFCPYEVGIIDVIGQTLLPKSPNEFQGIRAELYKLNVYQAPSGLFRPHVDTPRSDLQFGSLVVCLPCEHEGGQLVVRHEGQSTTFDWTGPAKDIQWAAFYSDCEHEVLEVTSGHRITLTYNLYVRRGLGELTGHTNAMDVQQLPLYHKVKAALNDPAFMPGGGILGKYCSHAYAHANTVGSKTFPAVLKGVDMVAYEVFRALNLTTRVRPVLYLQKDTESLEDEDEERGVAGCDRVGDKLSAPVMDYWGYHDSSLNQILDCYPHKTLRVKWLNNWAPDTANLQFSFAAYGNQAELGWKYSHCALLFEIPPYDKRLDLSSLSLAE